jgi:hypothetical protein
MYEVVSVASLSGMDWGGRYGNEALSGSGVKQLVHQAAAHDFANCYL